ncbi:MAG: hypothetical protein ACJA0N_001529 [Pseudohongiellaceae bacterium]|jgi:hypothetical protein
MLNFFKIQALVMLGLSFAFPVMADEASVPSSPEKFINVTFELHGLDESAKTIKEASLALATKVDQIELQSEKMTPEQLQALALVMQEANILLKSFEESVEQAAPTIESLRGATNSVVSDTFSTLYETTIKPTIQSVDSSVSTWLIIIFVGIFMILVIAGYYLYLATKQMRSMALILKSITDDYEIVPRRPAQVELEETEED